jgi:aldehyde dehydrogenase (NAD+)
LFNSGQVCFTATRLFVQKSIADTLITILKGAFEGAAQALGDQMQPETTLGPLADQKQLQRVLSFVEHGKSEAELIVGGERHGEQGCFIKPTIFINPKKDAGIGQEEIFGPVLVIITFEKEEEALEMANDTTYGLSGKLAHSVQFSDTMLIALFKKSMCLYGKYIQGIAGGTETASWYSGYKFQFLTRR